MAKDSFILTSRVSGVIMRIMAGGALAASSLLVGAASGASTFKYAAPSPFCQTLVSFSAVRGAPSTTNLSTYRHWIAVYLPKFERLDAEAPNASVKRVLDSLVTVLKSESSVSSAIKFEQNIAKNRKQWVNDWKVFASSALHCVTSLY
ncbi:MAG: hypothetical protein HKL86_01425 [Acidimicrobiaceae bacterium]|nr:hypothetical protein [Acidimicrobiaceae bacterium]